MENFRHAFSIHYPYWGGFWGWGRGAKPGTINLRGLCHFCPKKWSNFPSTKKISFVLLNITIVQLIITHINLGGAPWNGTFGFFEQCASPLFFEILFKAPNFLRWHAVMPLPLIAASDSFPILPLAIIFVNQRQGQYGTALFSGYHILPQPETMKNR